jgi:hypothetical protein
MEDPRAQRMRYLEQEAKWTRAQNAREFKVSRQRVTKILGKLPREARDYPRPMHNIYADNEPFMAARDVARSLGYRLKTGENAGEGSVGLMVEAIGKGELVVRKNAGATA